MPVRLRFAVHGTRNNRIFHLVAINSRMRRDAKPAETLAIYNPRLRPGQTQKTVEWSVDRIRYWLNVGAVPSRSVVKFLEMGNILPPDNKYRAKSAHPPAKPESTPTIVEATS